MPDVEINALASLGMIADSPSHQLPPEAWSYAEGVRFHNQLVERMQGWSQVFGTPTVVPHFVLGVLDAVRTPWWIYTSLTKAYVFNSNTHTDITRAAGGDYAAVSGLDWNGTVLAGIPIINNGADIPQFWSAYSAAQKLQDLNSWPATLRAKQVIAFGPFLFALNCTKSGDAAPHLVKWSHPAAPGALPVSWDETDLTRDTGEYEIPSDSPGGIVCGLALHDHLYIYKEGVVWRARYIGGRAVFAFTAFLNAVGIIGPRAVCVTPDGGRHVFVSNSDIMVHDGSSARSIADQRIRHEFFERLNPEQKDKTFVFANKSENEVWICFSETGSLVPNTAFVWNMEDDSWSVVLGINFTFAATGPVESTDDATWATVAETWDSIDSVWGQVMLDSVVLVAPALTKIALLNSGSTRLGEELVSVIRRTGLSVVGMARDRSPIVDFKRWKLITRLWLKGRGIFKIRLGVQEVPDGVVEWTAFQTFDTATQLWLDFSKSGRAMAIEIQDFNGASFSLVGYKIELKLLGTF